MPLETSYSRVIEQIEARAWFFQVLYGVEFNVNNPKHMIMAAYWLGHKEALKDKILEISKKYEQETNWDE